MSSTSGSAERSSGRTILAVILGIIALIFIVVAIIYVAEPAKSLPSFVPGHIDGSSRAPPAPGRGFARHRHRLRGRGLVRPGVQAQAAGRGGEQGKLARGGVDRRVPAAWQVSARDPSGARALRFPAAVGQPSLSAWRRSSSRSSQSSMPTDSRTRSAGDLERRAGHRGVRHPAGVLDQRLHPAERLGQREQPGPAARPSARPPRRPAAGTTPCRRTPASASPRSRGRDATAGPGRAPRPPPGARPASRATRIGVPAVPVHPRRRAS